MKFQKVLSSFLLSFLVVHSIFIRRTGSFFILVSLVHSRGPSLYLCSLYTAGAVILQGYDKPEKALLFLPEELHE